jgi:RHS repeat-associated protein
VSTEYQYDLASRMTALIYRNALGPLGDLQYGYDAAGNRTSVGGSFARTLLPDGVATSTYDGGNRQLAFGPQTMTFDDNGNLLTQTDPSGTLTYTWDARNRRTGLSGSAVAASFGYDAFGRRAQKTLDGGTTAFLYDGLDIVKETDGAGDASYLRTLGIDEALVRTDAVDSVHFLADALGSTLALTDPTGATATTYTFEPFGRTETTGPGPNPFQYTGRENDGTGLYYYRARYYDPGRSRFVSEDPIGLDGGDINLYAFVANSPLSLIDPSGLDFRPGPRGYGRPWNPGGIPHYHSILPGSAGGALVNPSDPGLFPVTTHDKNPLKGNLCIKCNWSVMRTCAATAPNPATVWSCYLCDQARLNGTPAIAIPSCLQCAGSAAVKYGECFSRACGVGRTEGCGSCR